MNLPHTRLILLLLLTSLAPAADIKPIDIAPADWPMHGHDAERTGSSPVDVAPPYTRAWVRYFHLEGLMPGVQAVSAAGRIYVGTLAGSVYCLDAHDGSIVWSAQTLSSVLHSVCVVKEGLVLVPCADGQLRALDARNGVEHWAFDLGLALWNSPVSAGGLAVIACRDGKLRAINIATGTKSWEADLGAPIVQSPAVDTRRAQVYVTTESLVTHAVSLKDGSRIWSSSQLLGSTAGSAHPVVAADGTVLVRSTPLFSSAAIRAALSSTAQALYPGTAAERRMAVEEAGHEKRWQAALAKTVNSNPATRSFYMLDPDSGEETAVAPVLYDAPAKGVAPPPIVTGDGRVLSNSLGLLPSNIASGHSASFVWVDTKTGDVRSLFDEKRALQLKPSLGFAAGGRHLVTLGGRGAEDMDGIDWTSSSPEPLYGYSTRESSYGVGIVERLIRGQTDIVDFAESDPPPHVGTGSDIAGSYQINAQPTPTILDRRIILVYTNRILALRHSDVPIRPRPVSSRSDVDIAPLSPEELDVVLEDWPIDWDQYGRPTSSKKTWFPPEINAPTGAASNPDDDAAEAHTDLPDEPLDALLWSGLKIEKVPENDYSRQLSAKLNKAVLEFVSEPRWRPLRFQGGDEPSATTSSLDDPSGTLIALALALPFLDTATDQATRAWVRSYWTERDPILDLERDPSARGRAREFYPYPFQGIDVPALPSIVRRRGIERAYAAWAWGYHSQDWSLVAQTWKRLRLVEDRGYHAQDEDNARCSGLLSMLRMARQFGDTKTEERIRPLARRAIRSRVRLEMRYPRGRVIGKSVGHWQTFRRWTHLSPDLAHILRKETVAGQLVFRYLDQLYPHWFLVHGPIGPNAGYNSMQLPSTTRAAFLAKALLTDASAAQMERWADVPAGRGDTDYILKLALTLIENAETAWVDLR